MILFKHNNVIHTQKGMVLVVALLVTAIVLSIGMNIANIAAKQLVLSSFNKESHKALFMADAALECVLYWDLTMDYNADYPGTDDDDRHFFKKYTTDPVSNPSAGNPSVYCFDSTNDLSMSERGNGENAYPIEIAFDLVQNNDPQSPCARVFITRTIGGGGGVETAIKTLGYNTCDPNNPRRVERGLEINY